MNPKHGSLFFAILIGWGTMVSGVERKEPAGADQLPDEPNIEPPRLELAAVKKEIGEGCYTLEFRIRNPNAGQALPYLGYAPAAFNPPLRGAEISPLYEIQIREGEEWVAQGPGWCGTGIGPVSLAPGETSEFEAYTGGIDGWKTIRIGVRWRTGQETEKHPPWRLVWSPPLSRDEMAVEANR